VLSLLPTIWTSKGCQRIHHRIVSATKITKVSTQIHSQRAFRSLVLLCDFSQLDAADDPALLWMPCCAELRTLHNAAIIQRSNVGSSFAELGTLYRTMDGTSIVFSSFDCQLRIVARASCHCRWRVDRKPCGHHYFRPLVRCIMQQNIDEGPHQSHSFARHL